ncbi:uncharacterized protein ACNS7B_008583 [Menidia menidia]
MAGPRCPLPALALCASLVLLLTGGCSEASVYHREGICSYREKSFQPGESFQRGCDSCFCHRFGFYCFSRMAPTSWPRKCRRLRTECGDTVVYRENPLVACRAYSWIG